MLDNKVFEDDFVQNYNNRQNKESACFTHTKLMRTKKSFRAIRMKYPTIVKERKEEKTGEHVLCLRNA